MFRCFLLVPYRCSVQTSSPRALSWRLRSPAASLDVRLAHWRDSSPQILGDSPPLPGSHPALSGAAPRGEPPMEASLHRRRRLPPSYCQDSWPVRCRDVRRSTRVKCRVQRQAVRPAPTLWRAATTALHLAAFPQRKFCCNSPQQRLARSRNKTRTSPWSNYPRDQRCMQTRFDPKFRMPPRPDGNPSKATYGPNTCRKLIAGQLTIR